ncbi:MAG: cytochrome b/b6 domain-containing protein [Rhodospirillaceae bacterium]|nr:cytochrome b/b6 domain-containing protein [Rhodospirillales bacterium]
MSHMGETTEVKVWDLPIRLFHWSLALTVSVLWITGQLGKLDIHMVLGLWVLALLIFRLGWGVIGSPTARFSQFVRGPGAIRDYLAAARAGTARSIGHNPLGALSVLALLGLLIAQSASGLFTTDDIFTDGPLVHLVTSKTAALLSSVHRIGGKVLLGLIAVHLAAVVFYKWVKKDDLVRAMFTGTKKVPMGVQGVRFANSWLAVVLFAVAAALVWGGLKVL